MHRMDDRDECTCRVRGEEHGCVKGCWIPITSLSFL